MREVALDLVEDALAALSPAAALSRAVLVEGEARPGDGPAAAISSWEHGLIRSPSAPEEWNRAGGRGRVWIARSQADAPGIDGRVYVRGRLPAGAFARVKIIGHTDYDLMAVPAG